MKIHEGDALFVADPQNDFMPGGALAIPEGDLIFDAVNGLTKMFGLVIASQDWHPVDHISFQARGGPWPPHCVQKTPGADFHPRLDQSRLGMIVRKAYDPEIEQYSAFEQGLAPMLLGRGTKRIFVTGVATDYCVLWSTTAALEGGLEVFVVTEGVRGIEAQPGDIERALSQMVEGGARIISMAEIEG